MVICLNRNYHGLTYREQYPVLERMMNGYVIFNDIGEKIYCRKQFNMKDIDGYPSVIDIQEIRNIKLTELFA